MESDKRHSSESGSPIDFMKDVKPAGHFSQGSLKRRFCLGFLFYFCHLYPDYHSLGRCVYWDC